MRPQVHAPTFTNPNFDPILAFEEISEAKEVGVGGDEDGEMTAEIEVVKAIEIIEIEETTERQEHFVTIEEVESGGQEKIAFVEVEDHHLLKVGGPLIMVQEIFGMRLLRWILIVHAENLVISRYQGVHLLQRRCHFEDMVGDEEEDAEEADFMMTIDQQAAVGPQSLFGIAELSRQPHLPHRYQRLDQHRLLVQLR